MCLFLFTFTRSTRGGLDLQKKVKMSVEERGSQAFLAPNGRKGWEWWQKPRNSCDFTAIRKVEESDALSKSTPRSDLDSGVDAKRMREYRKQFTQYEKTTRSRIGTFNTCVRNGSDWQPDAEQHKAAYNDTINAIANFDRLDYREQLDVLLPRAGEKCRFHAPRHGIWKDKNPGAMVTGHVYEVRMANCDKTGQRRHNHAVIDPAGSTHRMKARQFEHMVVIPFERVRRHEDGVKKHVLREVKATQAHKRPRVLDRTTQFLWEEVADRILFERITF